MSVRKANQINSLSLSLSLSLYCEVGKSLHRYVFNCGSLYIINVCPFVLAECRPYARDITPFVSSVVLSNPHPTKLILNCLSAPKVRRLVLFGLGIS